MARPFHNRTYLSFCCSGYLVMRQLGQLEMRQSRLSTHWSKPPLGARMTIFSLVETRSGRSRHVLYDHHVAERITSPRSHPEDP
ncbi:hypothetical protein C9417_30315 [Rhizobium sp. SEMIA 4088]|nr:hypothetical protein C9417_30315 [Rhizobium sp. SEMIA 4088]